ncbi:Flp family type IVb pilin [Zobellella denitrificans]
MFIAKELLRLVNDEDGLTTVEYAIAGALVAAAVVAAFSNLGTEVSSRIDSLCGVVKDGSAATSASSCL